MEVFAAGRVLDAQPPAVLEGLRAQAFYQAAGWTWVAAIALTVALGLAAALRRSAARWLTAAAPVVAVLAMAGMAGYRDGIRDLTLRGKGFDVWGRAVATNWTVVGLFLLLFLAGLGVAGWLISVMARSKKVMEGVA